MEEKEFWVMFKIAVQADVLDKSALYNHL